MTYFYFYYVLKTKSKMEESYNDPTIAKINKIRNSKIFLLFFFFFVIFLY